MSGNGATLAAARHRRPWARALVVLLAAVGLVLSPGGPAMADPEGGTETLRQKLDAASRGYVEAKAKLEQSQRKQAQIRQRLAETDRKLGGMVAEIGRTAGARYKASTFSMAAKLLDSSSPEDFLQGASIVQYVTWRDDGQLRQLRAVKEQQRVASEALNAEIRNHETHFRAMDKKKKEAEKALSSVGGVVSAGFSSGTLPLAKSAPRTGDGDFPSQGCTLDDPTTTGCISARMLHAYNEARLAGFKRHTSCYRSGGSGEHPKGKACDFSSNTSGFLNSDATGGDRQYGNKLAAWCVKNADRLGVLYVIWYRQVWMPGTGWRTYSGGSGPSAEHTNHLHLSMI